MADYDIPAHTTQCEIEVKKSRFIAFAAHTPGMQAAKDFIQSLKDTYPDARHHCYGFKAGKPTDSNLYGFSDDNEPSGTAGMPIFSHLQHSNLGEITIVVVRYFGGTKLGTGGLARAYGDAAKAVLEALPVKQFVEMEAMTLIVDFAEEAHIRTLITNAKGNVLEAHYSSQVTLNVEVPRGADLNLPYSVVPSRSTI